MENMKREECESANLANREMKGKDTNPVRCAPFEMDISRYSTLLRLKRVTAWCLRFIDKMRHRNENHSDLKKEEFEKAELLWIKHTQINHFPEAFKSVSNGKWKTIVNQLGVCVDDREVLRCKGRMENAELTEATRYPILLRVRLWPCKTGLSPPVTLCY